MLDKWIICTEPRPAATLDLFCFPPAGGTSALYRKWPAGLPESIEVHAIELPGRESRLGEAAFSRMAELLDELEPVIEAARSPGRAFAFFGHSMGGTIAFELTRRLRESERELPSVLCISGRRAPQLPDRFPLMHNLDEKDFIKGLRAYGGTPEAVLQNAELMDLFVPLLRADFSLFETWPYREQPPLPMPFLLFGGDEDPRALRSELQAWAEHCAGALRLRMLPGGHFFLRDNEELMLEALSEELQRAFSGSAVSL